MAISGGESTQRNICMYTNERRLCVLVIIPLHRIFFSDLKKGDLNLKSSTFKNNLLQIIGDIYASRKLV